MDFTLSNNYRKTIHNLIPGGAHTYSKGDDQFPLLSPAAIAYGKGAYVWDLDGNKFMDCLMGLTAVSLGHAYEPVLQRVIVELQKGANFSRPSYIEREMAEKFLSLVPQHDMIKFAKNGSTATTAAVKLGRAYTGRKLVAFPGNHPFYSYDDWFIGSTQCNKGVPEEIQKLSVTYEADNLASITDLFNRYPNQIACVISEPEKFNILEKYYLKNAIDLAHSNGAIYIMDEMITGFKTAFPGSITKYNVTPDIATWGKGIANGFSFCCMTGKKEIMQLGGISRVGEEKVFLTSTTHGGETHAIAACLATIKVFEEENVIAHNHEIGDMYLSENRNSLEQMGLSDYIQFTGFNWGPGMVCRNANKEIDLGMRTLLMQELAKREILSLGGFSPCYSHTIVDVYKFGVSFCEALEVYKKGLEDGYEKHLVGEPIKPVFRKII